MVVDPKSIIFSNVSLDRPIQIKRRLYYQGGSYKSDSFLISQIEQIWCQLAQSIRKDHLYVILQVSDWPTFVVVEGNYFIKLC